MAPRAALALIAGYIPYANANPTHLISHPWHRVGPRFLGAHGAISHSQLYVTTIDHLRTVHPSGSLHLYLDYTGAPHNSLILFRIHSDPELYKNWRRSLPLSEWSRYGLDKPIKEVLTRKVFEDVRGDGFTAKTLTLEELKKTIPKVN